jgi:lysophospholipase L1-like esterase
MTMNKYLIIFFSLWSIFLIALAIIGFKFAYKYYKELNYSRLYPVGCFHKLATSDTPAIILLGDSRAYAWDLEKNSLGKTINLGINGLTTEQLKILLKTDSITFVNSIILLQIGINDLRALSFFPLDKKLSLQKIENNFKEIIKLCLAKGAKKVILCTIFPIKKIPFYLKPLWPSEINDNLLRINQQLSKLQSNDVIIFDAFSLLKNTSGKMNVGNRLYYSDLLHLNDLGYKKLNERIRDIFSKIKVL